MCTHDTLRDQVNINTSALQHTVGPQWSGVFGFHRGQISVYPYVTILMPTKAFVEAVCGIKMDDQLC